MKLVWKWTLAGVVGAGLIGAQSVSAGHQDDKKKADFEADFKKLDGNSDGKVTLEEFKEKATEKQKPRADQIFARMDKDSDGKVTLEEYKEFRNTPRKKKKDK